MTNFLSKNDKQISEEFEKNGFLVKEVEEKNSLFKIRELFLKCIKKKIRAKFKFKKNDDILNLLHKNINSDEINDFRLEVINEVNRKKELRELYYLVAKKYLNSLVGNELAMQLRVNVSIQLPNDKSSLLPLHSDVWSGDSPFEIVVWLPLVDCYKTKSMYILPPNKYDKIKKFFLNKESSSSEKIFNKIKKDLKWINIKYGQILLFNQCLPHGNIVNKENETRWSLNCRFKGIFTPYNDKKIGEFFEPITLRKISEYGIRYKLPKTNEES
mgnify:CR=1 FL=1|tara:strand:- start:214 stop:1026 length:813 start_codon:yes stop_codon:yes gene_type:complete